MLTLKQVLKLRSYGNNLLISYLSREGLKVKRKECYGFGCIIGLMVNISFFYFLESI